MLYSHGNAANLGQIYHFFSHYSHHLWLNLLCYDYSGYAYSSEKIEKLHAYKCLVEMCGAKEEDIILYGQSVGSGPTTDFATHLPNLRALILHSPIFSGLRVILYKIPLVNCPVLLIHKFLIVILVIPGCPS
ncbi:hypothetical protein VNO78_14871 [Psophocarpus tetragonolobus]|uniref:Uncharacterized protein n=1 Tax=Psophocarpus tetragonolobus TaxID=3891 RepID=A0AAN9XJE1_PSOTE